MNAILMTILVGIGATLIMDIYSFILKFFNIKTLDYRFLGRWIGHFFNGKFAHKMIFDAPPIKYEFIIGQVTHYTIGVIFAFILVLSFGKMWLSNPVLFPALLTGIGTIVAPFFLMQPAFGLGIAGSNLPDPHKARVRSLIMHCVFGIGLFLSAIILNQIKNLL